jgi:hypothetical protein
MAGQQRAGGPLKLDHLPGEFVDAASDLRVAAEHLGFDLVDVVLQPGHHWGVAVDDGVEDGIEHGLWAPGQQVGVSLHAAAYGAQVAGLAMADGEYEVAAHEHMDLAEINLFDGVEVTRGAQHDEQGVAVAFQLRPLMGDDGVLHGQLVQPELPRHGEQLRFRGPVQPDPGHGVGLLT